MQIIKLNKISLLQTSLRINQLKNYKLIIRKFSKTAYSRSKDNIWGADLADMQLISKFNKGFTFFLCVIDIFSKYVWVLPLKDKKGVSTVDVFQKILDDSNGKPNKIWVVKEVNFTIVPLKNG